LAGLDEAPMQTPLYLISIVLIFIGAFAFVAVFVRAI
jgi:hypothetical protein